MKIQVVIAKKKIQNPFFGKDIFLSEIYLCLHILNFLEVVIKIIC